MLKNNFKYTHLFIVIAIAAFFRLIFITTSPPAINWDEASIGYNAYSILQTGHDEWGRGYPASFKAFGEYKLPGMIYASVPAIAVFGLSDFSIRLTPAIIGILTTYLLYLYVTNLFNKRVGLIASFILAVSPWHVHLSRVNFEAGLALLFFICSLLFFDKSLKRKNSPYILYSTVFLILSSFTYNSFRIIAPIIGTGYLLLFWAKLKLSYKQIFTSILIVAVAVLLSLKGAAQEDLFVRWDIVNFTNQPAYLYTIEEARNNFEGSELSAAVVHNRYTHYTYHLAKNLLTHYFPEFLFMSGDSYTQRSLQGMGVMHLYEIPLLLIGLYVLAKQSRKIKKTLIPLLLIAPIPASLTVNAPSALQSIALIVPLTILAALGVDHLFKLKFKSLVLNKWINLLVFSTIILSISAFSHKLFWLYPKEYSQDWQYGYRQVMQYVGDNYDDIDIIYITTKKGEPYIFTLLYSKYDPLLFQNSSDVNKNLDELGWVHVNSFDKYVFVNFSLPQWNPQELLSQENDIILVTIPGEVTTRFPNEIIKDPWGKSAFEIHNTKYESINQP